MLACVDLTFDRWLRTRSVFALMFFTIGMNYALLDAGYPWVTIRADERRPYFTGA